MMKYVFVEADVNDADYISQLSRLEEGREIEELILIGKVSRALKDFNAKNKYGHNWPDNDYDLKDVRELYKVF